MCIYLHVFRISGSLSSQKECYCFTAWRITKTILKMMSIFMITNRVKQQLVLSHVLNLAPVEMIDSILTAGYQLTCSLMDLRSASSPTWASFQLKFDKQTAIYCLICYFFCGIVVFRVFYFDRSSSCSTSSETLG